MKKRYKHVVLAVLLGFICLAAITASAGFLKPFGFTWGRPAVTAAASRSPMSSVLVDQGKNLLYARNNIIGARDKFLAAVNGDPADKEAQFYYGLTRVFAVYETGYVPGSPTMQSIRGLAELAGVAFVGTGTDGEILSYGLYNTSGQGADPLPNSTPRTSDALNFVKNSLLPEVDGAIANLTNASDTGFASSLVPTALDPSANNVAINVDYGDVLILKAALYATKTSIEVLLAYDLDVYLPPLVNGDKNDLLRVRDLIKNHPNVLTPSELQRLNNAKSALTNLADTFKAGVLAIKARAAKANHLFVLDVPLNQQTNELINNTSTDTDKFVSLLDDVKASLTGPRDFIASMPDELDFRRRTFDGSKFFNPGAPINVRDKILDANGDMYLNDLTFGGVIPFGVEGISEQIALLPGWNLITLPVIPMDLSIASVLAPIVGKYAVVWKYDPAAGWKRFRPGAADNTFTSFETHKAFWIYVNQFCLLPISGAHPPRSLTLKRGWNLVGCPGFVAGGPSYITTRDVDTALSNTGGVKYMWFYRGEGAWAFRSPILTTSLFPLFNYFRSPFGYWVNVQSDTVFAPPTIGISETDGYEVWAGNNDGGNVWAYKNDIIKNPVAFRYIPLGAVRLSDPGYTAKTFSLNNQYKYFVVRPLNPVADPVKIDSIAANGHCAGDYQGVSFAGHHTDNEINMYNFIWPPPANCPDGRYMTLPGGSGIMGIKDSYPGVPALNSITVYAVK